MDLCPRVLHTTIWISMKNIIFRSQFCGFILMVISTIIYTSCNQDDLSPSILTRVIANSSGHDLELQVYENGNIVSSIAIKNQKADTTIAKCFVGNSSQGIVKCSLSWALESFDSVQVVFDDLKTINYPYCEELPCSFNCADVPPNCFVNDKNIMYMSSEGGYFTPQLKIHVFEITEEDYVLAE